MPDFPRLPQEAIDQPSRIDFYFEEVSMASFQTELYINWIKKIISQHQCKLGQLQYVFCTDDALCRMNVTYLNHDTLTDIITFPYGEPPLISGDIFISLDRVADNARDRNIALDLELRRVIIHGVLHLCGYGDKTEDEAKKMSALEDEALGMMGDI